MTAASRKASFLGVFATALVLALTLGLGRGQAANNEDNQGAVPSGYKFDRQTAVFRSVAAVDSTGATSVSTGVTDFAVLGRQNVPVSARFSAASQTCKVRVYHYWKTTAGTYYFLGCSEEITLTGSSVQDATPEYVAPTYVFDSAGANVVKVVVTTMPTAGTLKLWVGSF